MGLTRRADPRLAAALDRRAAAVPPRRAVRLAGPARPDRGDRPGAAAAAGVGVRHRTARRRTRPAEGAVAMRQVFRDRRSLVEFLAIVGLVAPGDSRVGLHPRPPAAALAVGGRHRARGRVHATRRRSRPGQGQNVTVAGVEVGEITKVETEDGLAVVTVELDPDEVGPVYRNATMYLRPKTGLNDMTIQLDPGRPEAGARGRRPPRGRRPDRHRTDHDQREPGRGARAPRRRHAPLPGGRSPTPAARA